MAQVGRRALLQAQSHLGGLLEVEVRRLVKDAWLRPAPATTLAGRSARGGGARRLAHHFTLHGVHGRQFSTRRPNTAAWNGFQAARTTPADTCSSASALLRTFAIATPRVKTIRRGSRASLGHRGNG